MQCNSFHFFPNIVINLYFSHTISQKFRISTVHPRFYAQTDLPLPPVFQAEKAAFHMKKVAFEAEKAAFECYLSSIKANAPTKEKAATLFNEYMFETIFSRADIMKKFNMASSSAGKMLNKLKDSGIIEPVSGYGKGKYRFSKKNPAADEIKNQ